MSKRQEMTILSKLVDDDQYRVKSVRLRKALDEVKADHTPGCIRYRNRLEKPWRLSSLMLSLLAHLALEYILLNILLHVRPCKQCSNLVISSSDSTMTTNGTSM